MAGSVGFSQHFQKVHKFIGIFQKESKSIDTKSIICGMCSVQFLLTTLAFIVFEANSMFDYGFGFFVLILIIEAVVIYLLFIWQSANTLHFIDNCEKFIEKSKQQQTNNHNL